MEACKNTINNEHEENSEECRRNYRETQIVCAFYMSMRRKLASSAPGFPQWIDRRVEASPQWRCVVVSRVRDAYFDFRLFAVSTCVIPIIYDKNHGMAVWRQRRFIDVLPMFLSSLYRRYSVVPFLRASWGRYFSLIHQSIAR